jgi:uncharacterized protein YbjT (DUF2867 family)
MRNDKLVTVFGGSGFVGRHVVSKLARQGYRIRVAVRRPDLAGHLQPLGGVGQIQMVQANLRYRASIDAAVENAWGVVNLVGILFQSGNQRFDAVHDFGARAVARASEAAGVSRLVHMSSIGADPKSGAHYARSKAAGEAGVKDAFPGAAILRPSVIYGPGDGLFNRIAGLARMSPVFPLIGAETRFQPAFVRDVAEAAVKTLESGSGIYELGGPEIVTMRQMVELALEMTGRKRILIPVPAALARMEALFLQMLPNPLLTVDQVRMLGHDNVVSEAAINAQRTFEGLGISPTMMRLILPTYLERFRRTGQFEAVVR